VVLAIAISYLAGGNRIIRSMVLSIKQKDYVTAARALGATNSRILLHHIMPNTMAIYIILLSLHVGGAILAETSLSFLGLGVPPDEPTWGGLVGVGSGKFLALGPWLALFPGAAIALTVYGFNLFGDALRDVLDPRLRGSR
jgi:peptide/nickel transport system permease protein